MAFGKKYVLLIKLNYFHEEMRQESIKGTTLESILNVNYKQLHELAKDWETQGCIVSRTERGGHFEYQLTSIGQLTLSKIRQRRKTVKLIVFLIGLLIFGYYFL